MSKQGIWDEKSKTFIKASGTVKQGRRPMYQPSKPAQGHTPGPPQAPTRYELQRTVNSLEKLYKHACDARKRTEQLNADLLAACKAALTRLERLDDAGTGEYSPAYLQVQAAIAKAES